MGSTVEKKYVSDTALGILVNKLKSFFANKTELGEVKTLASNPSIKEKNKNKSENFWVGTKTEFNAVTTKDDTVTYIVTDDDTDTGYATVDEFNRLMTAKSAEIDSNVENNVNTQMANYKTNTLDPYVATAKSDMDSIKSDCETALANCTIVRNQTAGVRDDVNAVKAEIDKTVLIQGINVNGTAATVTDKTVNLSIPKVYASTSEPTASDGNDGDIWVVYE